MARGNATAETEPRFATAERPSVRGAAQVEIQTRQGTARAYLSAAADPLGALVLGHGAGGGVNAVDLQAAAAAALEQRVTVALVEQPYRVAGRRSPAPAPRLDAAWVDVIAELAVTELAGLALVTGGRSMGARVACRTAAETAAVGVLCLAFPLLSPTRAGTTKAPRSRLDELDGVRVPVLVIQGRNDPFGMPARARKRTVVAVAGNHSLRSDLHSVGSAVGDWLARLL